MTIIAPPPPAGHAYEPPAARDATAVPVQPPERAPHFLAHRLALAAVMVGSTLLALGQLVPPAAVPTTAPATEFSADRAARHLAVIARAPRPVGSAQHAATRAYLVAQIEQLGLRAEVQSATTVLRFPGAPGFGAGAVRNVVARIPGTASTGAILLGAHYDGGATGPAAGDCGACVVTLLETMRALRASPPLRNDVLFVFSDAEEMGDLGAHAFATRHPSMRDVRVSLNFESMGASGPVTLYATSPRDARLVDAVARAASHVVTSSFFAALHRKLPSIRAACDLQDYMDGGSAGLGFVFSGRSTAYHTILDDARGLDRRTLQHFGAYALPIVRHLGAMDLATLESRTSATFFTLWRGAVVRYAETWVAPLALLATLLLGVLLARGSRRRITSIRRVGLASLAFLGGVVAAVLLVTLAWWGLRAIDGNLRVFLIGNYATGWYVAGLWALAAAVMAAMHAWLRPRLGAVHVLAGALVGFALLALAATRYFPAGAYVFTWPVYAGLVPLAWLVLGRGSRPRSSWTRTAVIGIAIVPAVLVLVPVGLNTFVGLLVRLEGMSGAPLVAGATTFAALLTGLVLALHACAVGDPESAPVVEGARPPRRWLVARRAGEAALFLLAVATMRLRFDPAHPRPDQIRYELDTDRGRASWVTSDDRLDAWTTRFIPAATRREPGVGYGVPNGPATYRATAPVLPFAAPTFDVLEDAMESGIRVVRLRLRSPRGAPTLEVTLENETPIVAARIGGQPLDLGGYAPARAGVLLLRWAPMPAEGVELVLGTEGATPLRVTLVDWSDGLPAYAGAPSYVRPPGTMPAPGGTWDGIAVRRSHFVIPELGDGPRMAVDATVTGATSPQ